MKEVRLNRLPNFEHIDLDICRHLRQFSAPPNSVAQSICSGPTLKIQDDHEFYRTKRIDDDAEFLQFKPSPLPPLPRFPPLGPASVCVPKPCQIPQPSLEFITRPIPSPQWNTTYCLERIKCLVTSPELGNMSIRIDEIWSLYLKKCENGPLLRDLHELSKIIRYLDLEYPEPDFAQEFISKILQHLRKGIRVKRMSENNESDSLRLFFDSCGRIIKFGHSALRLSFLQLVDAWLGIFTDAPPSKETFTARFDAPPKPKHCFTKQWEITAENRMYQKDVRCDQFKNHLQLPPVTAKCVAGCEISIPKPLESPEAMLSGSSFFGALELSLLPSVLEQFISGNDVDESYVLALRIVRRMCENSYCIRSCVVNSSIIDSSLLKLGYTDADQNALPRTVELLYSILISPDYNGINIYAVPHQDSFEMLLYRFMNVMICNDRASVNPLRNDLAFIIYLLPLYCPPLRNAFFKHLRDFAAILANNILTEQSFEIVLDSTVEDLELVQYFIWILELTIPYNPDYYYIIEMYQLVPVLTRLIVGPCRLIDEVGPASTCAENITRSAWKALVSFARIQPLLFLHPEGILTMLTTLQAFGLSGNVSLITVEAFLDILGTVLIQANDNIDDYADQIIPYFAKRNATEVFCSGLKRLSRESFSISLEGTLSKVLLCCSELGKYDEALKVEFSSKKGVKAVIRLLHMLLYTPAQIRHMNPMLHIMVADCIWNCIADCPSGLEVFLLYEGMFRLLDLLEIAASPVAKLHILGALVDLCDYSRCADQMMYWRRQLRHKTARLSHGSHFHLPAARTPKQVHSMLSNEMGELVDDNDQNLAALLCELWRDEERRLGVLRDEDQVISSLEYPTMSKYGRDYKRKIHNGRPLPPNSPGQSCLDMMGSIRPRIFLLVKAVTEGTNTEASVFSGLCLKNQVTMQTILNYLDLKRSEIWLEIDAELRAEGIEIVSSDQNGIQCMLNICRNKIGAVVNTQRYLIQRGKEQAAMNEREVYNLIRNCQIQDHLVALREAQYYATLSDYYLLLDKRLWHTTKINDIFLRSEDASIIKAPVPKKSRAIQAGGVPVSSRGSELDLGPFGISLDVDLSKANMIPAEPDTREILQSMHGSPMDLNYSPEGGHYQVSPAVLFKALTKLIAQQKQWAGKDVDEEREWLMRKKWNADWYPKAREHL